MLNRIHAELDYWSSGVPRLLAPVPNLDWPLKLCLKTWHSIWAPCAGAWGQDDEVDLNVRKCWEMPERDSDGYMRDKGETYFMTYATEYTRLLSVDSRQSELLQAIKAQLAPFAPYITAERHKMVIYGPGSFFKAHVDTQRCPGHFDSLAIHLPQPHKGGCFKVRHRGEGFAFDFAQAAINPNLYNWVAFYTDCEHEVDKLKGEDACLYRLLTDLAREPPLSQVAKAGKAFRLVNVVIRELGEGESDEGTYAKMLYPGNHPRRYTVAGVELYPEHLRRSPGVLTWWYVDLDHGNSGEILIVRQNYAAGGQLMAHAVTPSANDGCMIENLYLATALVMRETSFL
ncbi:hypothetical protein WJX72_008893 [[Myrmecia] bisecta]|uniref:Prolyl 4-hydroxylase alpha subunit Fe(2+) 2OG dioxygenase domain-containing protein n=1 Tax=[Myrmecia] bisecta TaxID=41462 RepID=A0AAW1QS10_9CHLO